jgi:DNA-binding XRE family transcriptional regulator
MDDKAGKLEATEYIAVTLEEDGKMLGNLMMPADSIEGLPEDEVTRLTLAAYRRLQAAERILNQTTIREAADADGPKLLQSLARIAAGTCAFDILTAWKERALHDAAEAAYLKELATKPGALKRVLDETTKLLGAMLLEMLEETNEAQNLHNWIWQHIIATALEDLEAVHGAEAIAAMAAEPLLALLHELLGATDTRAAAISLLSIRGQDLANTLAEALDIPNRTPDELHELLGFKPITGKTTAVTTVAGAPSPFPPSPNPFARGMAYISTSPIGYGACRAIFGAHQGWHDDESGNPRFVHKVEGRKLKGAVSYHILAPSSSEEFALAHKELAHAILRDLGPDTAWLHMALLAYAAQTPQGETFVIPREVVYRVLGLDKRTDLKRGGEDLDEYRGKDRRCLEQVQNLLCLGVSITFMQLDGRQLNYSREIGRLWDITLHEYGQAYLTPETVGRWTRRFQEWQLRGKPGSLWADPFLYGEPMRQIGVMAQAMIENIDRRKAPLGAGLAVQLVFQSRFSSDEIVWIRNRDILAFVGEDLQQTDRRRRYDLRTQLHDAILEQERWGWRLDFSRWPTALQPDLDAADAMLTGDGSEATPKRLPEGYWEPFLDASTGFIPPDPMAKANRKATKGLPTPKERKRNGMTALEFKEIRQRLGWTQAEMAQYLGVSQSLVSRMEKGLRDVKPTYAMKLRQAER